jgi:hypothetical protein
VCVWWVCECACECECECVGRGCESVCWGVFVSMCVSVWVCEGACVRVWGWVCGCMRVHVCMCACVCVSLSTHPRTKPSDL